MLDIIQIFLIISSKRGTYKSIFLATHLQPIWKIMKEKYKSINLIFNDHYLNPGEKHRLETK